jgi:hypothetical protein
MTNSPAHNGAPLLAACIYSVQGNADATLKIIQSYRVILEHRLSYDIVEPANSFIGSGFGRDWIEEDAKDEWLDLLDWLPTGPMVVPTFEAIWVEAGALLHSALGRRSIEEDQAKLREHLDYQGLLLPPMIVHVFEIARSCHQIQDWIASIINAQPRYNDLRSNHTNQIMERQQEGTDTFPDLARAIKVLKDDPTAVFRVIQCFACWVQTAANHVINCVARPPATPEVPVVISIQLDDTLDIMIKHHRINNSNPFSDDTLQTRQQLVQCNVRGTYALMINDALKLGPQAANSVGPHELSWYMFKKFVSGIMQVASTQGSACVSVVRDSLEKLRLEHFLNPHAQLIPLWTWDPSPIIWDSDSDSDDDSEEDLDDLPDVCVEPVGPDFKAEHHATAVTSTSDLPEEDCSICRDTLNVHETIRDEVPVKIKCGHCFHYGCLTTLINGISKFSNLCPNCRAEVCKRRPRRLKNGKKLDDAQGTEGANGAEPERFLQDRHGDVVMTDD